MTFAAIFPEIPHYGDTVSIKHLLYHTSGLKDQEELVKIKGLEPYGSHMTNEYAVALIARQKSLNFQPGSVYEYSNANYVVLTAIVERVSGLPLEAFAQKHIFSPLGMEKTFFNPDQGKDFENRAIGYEPHEAGYEPAIYESHIIGDGGIFTTLRDMIKWDQNFYQNSLGKGSKSLTERMKYRENLSNGREIGMAFGQIRTPHSFGLVSWSHGGSGGGYRTFYIRLEEPEFSVIAMSNADDGNSFGKANAVVDLFFNPNPSPRPMPGPMEDTYTRKTPIPITEKMVKRLSGYYLHPQQLQVVEIVYVPERREFDLTWIEDGAQAYTVVPVDSLSLGEKEDLAYEYSLEPERNLLVHSIRGRRDMEFEKLNPASEDLRPYTGTYYSGELDHRLELGLNSTSLESENLYFQALKPIGKDFFRDQSSGAIVSFGRSKKGEIDSLSLDVLVGGRSLRNIRFYKK